MSVGLSKLIQFLLYGMNILLYHQILTEHIYMTRALFIPVALWKQGIIWERYGHVGFCKAKKTLYEGK